jgi:SAM-dependent methyltransferase
MSRSRIGREFFEELYAGSEDPWGFATSRYERDKYADTLAALDGACFERALEVGCSIGVFTKRLADVCGELTAIDVSSQAIARARRRLRGHPRVTFERMSFPEDMPAGRWDLVVCSEVLYYFDEDAFALALTRLRAALEDGATVLAVHWRPATRSYPLRGDQVHDRLIEELGEWHVRDGRRERYRLDLFGGQ